ncbi:helix-turn-helix domain-containing protein [Streptomyces antimycoticus]|uniref:helix-turn-helix domain-containing protein n=1 Tax=Streptomyces antimycoticus TaxID=68175 RepID=UPI00191B9F49|nr:helix-turn-helix transcriptional regulator [Streptomyces antimycoticus]
MDNPDNPAEDVLAGVGPRLRALRRARSATPAALANETGLTASTLSRPENGKLRPTLEQLLPLDRAHGVPLDDPVAAAHPPAAGAAIRADDGAADQAGG